MGNSSGGIPYKHCRTPLGTYLQEYGGQRHRHALPHHGTHLVLRTLWLELKLYIATSLDGYIATADGSVEWLDAYQSDEEDYGYHRFYDSVDTLLMGGNTNRTILGFGCDWPYS